MSQQQQNLIHFVANSALLSSVSFFFSLQVSQALQTLEQFSSREAQKRAALEAFDMPYAASCTRACKQFQSRGLPGVLSALPIFHYRQFSMPYLFLLLHRQRSLTVARNSKAHSRSNNVDENSWPIEEFLLKESLYSILRPDFQLVTKPSGRKK